MFFIALPASAARMCFRTAWTGLGWIGLGRLSKPAAISKPLVIISFFVLSLLL
jgi:hypothetical protein